MIDIESVEHTIATLRTQAAQLQAAATALETVIEPWRQVQNMIKSNQEMAQLWMNLWTQPSLK